LAGEVVPIAAIIILAMGHTVVGDTTSTNITTMIVAGMAPVPTLINRSNMEITLLHWILQFIHK
jgi:hypothetical protein